MMLESKQPEYVKEKINIAIENLMSGYSCSEAVLLTYSPQFSLQRESAFKIASGFGGGMGWMGSHLAGFKEIAVIMHTDCGCSLAYHNVDKIIEHMEASPGAARKRTAMTRKMVAATVPAIFLPTTLADFPKIIDTLGRNLKEN